MKNKKILTSITQSLLLSTGLLLSLSVGLAIGYVGGLVKDQSVLTQKEMKDQINNISKNSEVYFGSGEKLGTINSELIRKTVTYEELGDNVKNAIIASEDSNFYSNSGVDIFAVLRASLSEVTGAKTSGGSTITQQLVKNQLLDNSRSYERKAKEILLALRVDSHFSKNEILENYLNVAPFGKNSLGQNISGIETAAQGVFGVHSKDLNIAQAAYLVGFVQSPYKYTPFDSAGNIRSTEELQAGFERQQYVLERMLSNNFITKEQFEEAKKFDIKGAYTKQKYSEYTDYPYIRDEVTSSVAEILAEQTAKKNNRKEEFKNDSDYRNELIEKSRIKFITGGYKVKTTLDKKLYDTLQETKKQFASYPTYTQGGVVYPLEIGASVIENNTGKVLAFIGGMNYKKQQLNHATRTRRSPGSTIKPLLVYGPAIDKGYITPNSTVLDKRFNHYGWRPENYDMSERGYLPAREALARSLNLPTVRLYSAFYKEDPVTNYLEKMDIEGLTESDKANLATAIGGMTYGLSVTENTSAFSTFANKGEHKKAHIIEEIENNDGELVYKADFSAVKVFEESTSYLIVDMLGDVINKSYGTSHDMPSKLKFNSKNLFVKTGTSEYYKDLWVVGGSTKITVGLWNGYDSPAKVPSYDYAQRSWVAVMNAIYALDKNLIAPDTAFSRPKSVVDASINGYNNAKGGTKDIVPNGFKELSKEKTLAKFGYNIDKGISFNDPSKVVVTKPVQKEEKKDDKDKKDKKEEKEERTETSPPPILKPTVITEEDEE
ncbi:transglycosylase domain-containing protein [uncultured Gemella sp.]|uniref:transglycosylase domain-containing protein n=1 Tax=uncultured Gemella sp. TaxID=254352 RepID=UPI00260C7791|nr:transglycosylase domain-containing protein [uncultured Gemella sp.]